MSQYYIASCVFTSKFPELSFRIREYVRGRFGMETVRCCVPKYKITEFEDKMPKGSLWEAWRSLPDSGDFQAGDEVFSLCHNCNNIIEEMHPGVHDHSLWELLDTDNSFPFPDFHGKTAVIQDCWRSRDRKEEQDAVRSLLRKMNISFIEAEENRERTDFCGISLYRPQPPRNPKLAPKHYVEGAVGKFIPHSPEEQEQLMKDYCSRLPMNKVICYCHYCLEGLLLGNANAHHIAQLLFPENE